MYNRGVGHKNSEFKFIVIEFSLEYILDILVFSYIIFKFDLLEKAGVKKIMIRTAIIR